MRSDLVGEQRWAGLTRRGCDELVKTRARLRGIRVAAGARSGPASMRPVTTWPGRSGPGVTGPRESRLLRCGRRATNGVGERTPTRKKLGG